MNVGHPVTGVDWRSAMVWCNALTEWYNAAADAEYSVVYTVNGRPLRDSLDAAACDAVVPDAAAGGFRLPTNNEWELAARWRDDAVNAVGGYADPWFTRGNAASGATAACEDEQATALVAVFGAASTSEVQSRAPNALGLYDMSGNVAEWCFDEQSDRRAVRGGSYMGVSINLRLGETNWEWPDNQLGTIGFRIAMSGGSSGN
jgi:formylglycine-generating enzyme